MRVSRIYDDQPLVTGESITLSKEASHHLATVLRAKAGQMLIVFNGDGNDYIGKIDSISKKALTFTIEEQQFILNESPLNIHLAQAISKGDRMDYVIQKSVELGTKEITPLFTERCNVKLDGDRLAKKVAHWQKVAIHAAEQCGRAIITQINEPMTLNEWIKQDHSGLKVILHHRNTKPLSEIKQPSPDVFLIVGPEGGFTDTEVADCQLHSYQPLILGPRVFRTETAPLVAMAVLQSMWGDLS